MDFSHEDDDLGLIDISAAATGHVYPQFKPQRYERPAPDFQHAVGVTPSYHLQIGLLPS